MRTILAAAALGLALVARPHSAVTQELAGDGKNVFAVSMGYNPAPVGGFAVTGLYGRDIAFLRGVVAVDAITPGDAAGEHYLDAAGTGLCHDLDNGEIADASNCIGDMVFAGRGELLVRAPLGLSFGPGVRFRRDMAPYGVAQLDAAVGPASTYVVFARGAYGEDFRQFDVGLGYRF
ncbi:hypothetical protein [Longimicrobium sp.]|uniref:hypothetical protein n=1 Tax=Longimicrobium sp. TaxID=2029185 RepID=UPI003B3B2635